LLIDKIRRRKPKKKRDEIGQDPKFSEYPPKGMNGYPEKGNDRPDGDRGKCEKVLQYSPYRGEVMSAFKCIIIIIAACLSLILEGFYGVFSACRTPRF